MKAICLQIVLQLYFIIIKLRLFKMSAARTRALYHFLIWPVCMYYQNYPTSLPSVRILLLHLSTIPIHLICYIHFHECFHRYMTASYNVFDDFPNWTLSNIYNFIVDIWNIFTEIAVINNLLPLSQPYFFSLNYSIDILLLVVQGSFLASAITLLPYSTCRHLT